MPKLVRFLSSYRMMAGKTVKAVLRHDDNLGWHFCSRLTVDEKPTHKVLVLTVAPRLDMWKAWQVEAEVSKYGH